MTQTTKFLQQLCSPSPLYRAVVSAKTSQKWRTILPFL